MKLLKNFLFFFSELKLNIIKCKIAGLGPLKRVLEAVCGLKTVDLINDAIKILGIHFPYHNVTKTERNFLSTVNKIQNALNVWSTRTLTLERRILIFKTLGISKIVYLSLITTVPNLILNKIFLWYPSKPKINYTLQYLWRRRFEECWYKGKNN